MREEREEERGAYHNRAIKVVQLNTLLDDSRFAKDNSIKEGSHLEVEVLSSLFVLREASQEDV